MNGHGEKLSRNQEKAIAALLSQPTLKEAAEVIGVGETTLRRWMQLDQFQEQYNEAKRKTVSHVTARLRSSMTYAVDALTEMAQNPKTPAMARASACRTLLEYGMKAHEMEDLQVRMERLEESLESESG